MATATKKARGRPPKTAAERKRNNVTIRMRDATKADLEAAAAGNQRSLSEEIEFRLEESSAAFGGPEIHKMARLMADAFLRGGRRAATASRHPTWQPKDWMDDAFCYEAALAEVVAALRSAQPVEYESGHPDPEQRAIHKKIHDTLAGFAGRGFNVQRSPGGKKGASK